MGSWVLRPVPLGKKWTAQSRTQLNREGKRKNYWGGVIENHERRCGSSVRTVQWARLSHGRIIARGDGVFVPGS